MTNDNDRLQREIEAGELWLAEALLQSPEPRCPSLESLKHRVRIEVHEQAIAIGGEPEAPPAVIEAIKRKVRAELSADAVDAVGAVDAAGAVGVNVCRRGQPDWWLRHRALVGVLAAAAMVALVVTPQVWDAQGPDGPARQVGFDSGEQDQTTLEWDDYESVLGATSDLEVELSSLDSAIDSLSDGVAWPTDTFVDLDVDLQQGALDIAGDAYAA